MKCIEKQHKIDINSLPDLSLFLNDLSSLTLFIAIHLFDYFEVRDYFGAIDAFSHSYICGGFIIYTITTYSLLGV